jgi:hypothetical protein
MAALTQELGMSTGTLRWRPHEHQTSYHEILDRVCRGIASFA